MRMIKREGPKVKLPKQKNFLPYPKKFLIDPYFWKNPRKCKTNVKMIPKDERKEKGS